MQMNIVTARALPGYFRETADVDLPAAVETRLRREAREVEHRMERHKRERADDRREQVRA